MVVAIHLHTRHRESYIYFCRIAVPCFFMISGYFLVGEDGTFSSARVWRNVRKMLRLVVGANVLYFAICSLWPDVIGTFFEPRDPGHWRAFMVDGATVIYHLWYLMAMLQILLLCLVFRGRTGTNCLYVLGAAGLIVGLCISSLYDLYAGHSSPFPPNAIRNSLTIGLPSFMAGCLVRRYDNEAKLTLPWTLLATAVFTVLLYGEYHLFRYLRPHYRMYELGVMTLPLAICTFLSFKRLPCTTPLLSALARIGKQHSGSFYIWHLAVVYWLFDIHPALARTIVAWNIPGLDAACLASRFPMLAMAIVLTLLWVVALSHVHRGLRSALKRMQSVRLGKSIG